MDPPAPVGTIAPGTLRVTGAPQLTAAPGFPDEKTSGPDIWRPFLAKTKPSVSAVQRHVKYLTAQQKHEHVIALIQAAIIEGQAQPWMYEVLAVTMKYANYPEDDIERVVLSIADFGSASYESMMYSGAYLKNLGHDAAALRMYRQAARLAPERAEPYALSMKLAGQTGEIDDAIWAASGVLRNGWSIDHDRLHEQAEDLLAETRKKLQLPQQKDQLARLDESAIEARRRDLQVSLKWNGTGDLDLSVQDPSGGISSFENRESAGGGYLLNDGYGPDPENCHEDFVCPVGFSGEYIFQVTKGEGKIVGDRAVLTIITHAGSPSEKKITQTVRFDQVPPPNPKTKEPALQSNKQVIRITLEDGRREQRRAVLFAAPPGVAENWERVASDVGRPRPRVVSREVRQAVAEMRTSRQQGAGAAAGGRGVGAVGFAPVVSLIPIGTSLATRAVVSADRRYVRMALSPSFNQIIDVAVFSFQGGNAGTTTTGR